MMGACKSIDYTVEEPRSHTRATADKLYGFSGASLSPLFGQKVKALHVIAG